MIIKTVIKGFSFEFETSPGLFSPRYVDGGTLAMLQCIEFQPGQKVLDLGCGYGVVGITASRFTDPAMVYMSDVDPAAVACAEKNAVTNNTEGVHILQSDGLEALRETDFDLILSNPPYHTDFSIARKFIEKGFNRLKVGGKMLMVTKRRDWYRNKFISVFGGVRIHETQGYFVFEAEKRSRNFAGHK